MPLTRDQQIANLLSMGVKNHLGSFQIALIVLLGGLLCSGIITGHPVFFMIAAFTGVVALSSWQTSPHIKNAVKGATEGQWSRSEILIQITRWSDSNSYHATIQENDYQSWEFEFIPQGWQPAEGVIAAEVCFIPGVAWPVLLLTDTGIIYPRYTPKRIQSPP